MRWIALARARARLDGLLRSSPAMRREYRCYLEVHAGLGLIAGRSGQAPPVESVQPAHPACLPPYSYLGSSRGLSLSYAFAVLLLSMGVLAAWAWRGPVERGGLSFAKNNSPAAGTAAAAPVVAKVTRLVGGDWRGQMAVGADVPSDHCFVLSRGILELTYNTGAKVTLEGPTLFYVDSPRGGTLQQGKATVSTPRATDRPLFCVRSRTAVVTERGNCEFGLEVEAVGSEPSSMSFGATSSFSCPAAAPSRKCLFWRLRMAVLAV